MARCGHSDGHCDICSICCRCDEVEELRDQLAAAADVIADMEADSLDVSRVMRRCFTPKED